MHAHLFRGVKQTDASVSSSDSFVFPLDGSLTVNSSLTAHYLYTTQLSFLSLRKLWGFFIVRVFFW